MLDLTAVVMATACFTFASSLPARGAVISQTGGIAAASAAQKTAAAKAPATKPPAAKTPAVPEIQTQCHAVLVQLEIMPKPDKKSPKLSDKISYKDFSLYAAKAMGNDPPKAAGKAANVTFEEAEALLLKALGYGKSIEGKTPAQIIDTASGLGLALDLKVTAGKHITFGEASVLLYNSLTVPFANAVQNPAPNTEQSPPPDTDNPGEGQP